MGLYEGIKDAIGIAQKADNIELYRQLIDLSSQALDMQTEIAKLREENSELQKSKETEQRLVRHEQPYLTLEGDNPTFGIVRWSLSSLNFFNSAIFSKAEHLCIVRSYVFST